MTGPGNRPAGTRVPDPARPDGGAPSPRGRGNNCYLVTFIADRCGTTAMTAVTPGVRSRSPAGPAAGHARSARASVSALDWWCCPSTNSAEAELAGGPRQRRPRLEFAEQAGDVGGRGQIRGGRRRVGQVPAEHPAERGDHCGERRQAAPGDLVRVPAAARAGAAGRQVAGQAGQAAGQVRAGAGSC